MQRQVFIPPLHEAPLPPPAHASVIRLSGATMGTHWHVDLVLSTAKDKSEAEQQSAQSARAAQETLLQAGIQAQLDQVVTQMSTWDSQSDLCQFNCAAAGSWIPLAPEFFKVLDYAVFLAQQTRGAYDPAAARLVDLWGFGPKGKRQDCPDDIAIQEARNTPGWRSLQLRRLTGEALQAGGVQLDLSSIAKGFGVDQVARYLHQQQIGSYLIEVGGELRGHGVKPDGQPWWVSIEQAGLEQQEQIRDAENVLQTAEMNDAMHNHLLALHGMSVATSGNYRQYFYDGGRRYAHTIDARSGYPVSHDLCSVTVLHPECMVADALATALFVMGATEGMQYANQHQLAVLFVRGIHSDTETRYPHHTEESMSQALIAMLD